MTEIIDLEQGAAYGYHRRSFGGSDVSVYYSDGEDMTSWVVETSGGGAMELGCSCKEDLAIAHRQCAETWFKIKGDKICEICQSVAKNVGGANEMHVTSTVEERELRNGGGGEETAAVAAAIAIENRWQPQRVVNIVLACMVFGFVISWLFHFHVSSSS
ncbi:unnamed protein product [Eruca vesicaria subsp. sativa]|uniref:RING-CH-type domain-containing protein n=1 Tax=Eruca vesicaria subsp. sativa TaxID=29727 RepID=A0ABC8M8X5_ERUVS|nr:unnamed protein product [Eruca vesicaria subsp. sativa]